MGLLLDYTKCDLDQRSRSQGQPLENDIDDKILKLHTLGSLKSSRKITREDGYAHITALIASHSLKRYDYHSNLAFARIY